MFYHYLLESDYLPPTTPFKQRNLNGSLITLPLPDDLLRYNQSAIRFVYQPRKIDKTFNMHGDIEIHITVEGKVYRLMVDKNFLKEIKLATPKLQGATFTREEITLSCIHLTQADKPVTVDRVLSMVTNPSYFTGLFYEIGKKTAELLNKKYNLKKYKFVMDTRGPIYRLYNLLNKCSTQKPDKWNPADIWGFSPDFLKELKKLETSFDKIPTNKQLSVLNEFVYSQFTVGNLLPISLKNPNDVNKITIKEKNPQDAAKTMPVKLKYKKSKIPVTCGSMFLNTSDPRFTLMFDLSSSLTPSWDTRNGVDNYQMGGFSSTMNNPEMLSRLNTKGYIIYNNKGGTKVPNNPTREQFEECRLIFEKYKRYILPPNKSRKHPNALPLHQQKYEDYDIKGRQRYLVISTHFRLIFENFEEVMYIAQTVGLSQTKQSSFHIIVGT